ncbi:glycoside hydrolase family 30 protein [Flavimarina sp. Hel_I_48]|uniref:glycoside hydrolase family 30 protein n=1 Tax=Flavimarina sp. Hel_I_48 TaxID=1392488 RepID=UPI000689B35D|nr:glycoside hydrolase family 30 beta sandwich domain-containing protein [Flavimarina sp. Hel_I_48]
MKQYLFPIIAFLILLFSACAEEEKSKETAHFYLTTLDKSALMKEIEIPVNELKTDSNGLKITLNPAETYQEMDGFGYTLTGGSALHIHNMSDSARGALLHELFGREKDQLGVSYLRLSLGASDLDAEPFSYDDLPTGETDKTLEYFSLSQDTLHLIPVLKEILKISPDIKILSSPWSPPVWMKDNGDTRGGSLQEKYYNVYARYFVKYIQAMAENGITIDAVTVQNEPLHPGNNPSLLMEADAQRDFVKNALGPIFQKNNIKTKIIVYDHNADRPDYPMAILANSAAFNYVDGSAFHLYGGDIDALKKVHDAYPNKNLYFTEQWVGAPGDFAKEMSWHTENLIIGATRNWCKTVLEWNLAADENQKPHTNRGGCDRCLGAVTITGDNVTREPAYYIIGQASRFVPPGSLRIASNEVEGIPNVAFNTPDDRLVLILQNKTSNGKKINIVAKGETLEIELEAGAVGTLVF